jgi:hypothetical protein
MSFRVMERGAEAIFRVKNKKDGEMTDTELPAQVARYRSVPPSRAHVMEGRRGVLFLFVQSCKEP